MTAEGTVGAPTCLCLDAVEVAQEREARARSVLAACNIGDNSITQVKQNLY
jgi:hypothetical protein